MDEYSDHHCRDCGEDLFQLSGDWLCPECDNVEQFALDYQKEEFAL